MNKRTRNPQFESIRSLFLNENIDEVGFCKIDDVTTLPIYIDWVNKGMAGDMQYLQEQIPIKQNPEKLLQKVKTVISCQVPYFPHPRPNNKVPKALTSAMYTQGEDYHFWFKEKLQAIAFQLEKQIPGHAFSVFVDSAPVLERELAYRSGLGWVGKNTCLIHEKKGSLFFIGEIYTTLEISGSIELAADRCGKCTRCIDACPTNALNERELDANKCISYLTIEKKGLPDPILREKIGPWFFGCDICQAVCPWNEKLWGEVLAPFKQGRQESGLTPIQDIERKNLVIEIRQILNSSNKALEKKFHGTALLRARPKGLKRNAMIVAANLNLYELIETIQPYTEHDDLGELALWCLEKLNPTH